MLAHHFSHYYSQRCWRMVSELAGVINPSCPDQNKLSVRFQPWICWKLCWGIDVGPPLFTLRYYSRRCRWMVSKLVGVISPSCHDYTKLSIQFQLWNCWRLCWGIDVGPPHFHTITTGDADGWYLNGRCDQPLELKRLFYNSGWISPVIELEWWCVLNTQHSPGVVFFDNIYPRRSVLVTIFNKLNNFKNTHSGTLRDVEKSPHFLFVIGLYVDVWTKSVPTRSGTR